MGDAKALDTSANIQGFLETLKLLGVSGLRSKGKKEGSVSKIWKAMTKECCSFCIFSGLLTRGKDRRGPSARSWLD